NALRGDPERQMARMFTLPTERSFAMDGIARLDSRAPASVIDAAIGLPDAEHGGVTVSEERHLTGAADQRATVAIDGDDRTWWSTGFQSSVGDWAQYRTAEPISFDHLDLQVVADSRHSIPTRLQVEV